MKTHWKKLRNPDYIGSYELMIEDGKSKELVVTIKDVKKEMVMSGDGKKDECMVAHLVDQKPFILNATNAKTIASLYGAFIEDWQGKTITLFVQRVKAFGGWHDALRVRPNAPTLPSMNPSHKNWAMVLDKISKGTATVEQVQSNFALSPNDLKTLQDARPK
jgi:hypothetical protein